MVLNKAKKKLITQKPAAEELSITERHVRRLLRELQRRQCGGARATGLPSNRKISADTEKEAVAILSQPVYLGFGPTLAAEYLAKKHGIEVSRETVRLWMTWAKLWRPANRALLEREAAGLGRATPTWHDTALQMWVDACWPVEMPHTQAMAIQDRRGNPDRHLATGVGLVRLLVPHGVRRSGRHTMSYASAYNNSGVGSSVGLRRGLPPRHSYVAEWPDRARDIYGRHRPHGQDAGE